MGGSDDPQFSLSIVTHHSNNVPLGLDSSLVLMNGNGRRRRQQRQHNAICASDAEDVDGDADGYGNSLGLLHRSDIEWDPIVFHLHDDEVVHWEDGPEDSWW